MTHTLDSEVSLHYWLLWPTVRHQTVATELHLNLKIRHNYYNVVFIEASVSVRLVQLNILESLTFSRFLSYDQDSLARPGPPALAASGTKPSPQNFIQILKFAT